MKQILFSICIFSLFGVTEKKEIPAKKYIKDPRPTLEQQVQLAQNELLRLNSKFDETVAEIPEK